MGKNFRHQLYYSHLGLQKKLLGDKDGMVSVPDRLCKGQAGCSQPEVQNGSFTSVTVTVTVTSCKKSHWVIGDFWLSHLHHYPIRGAVTSQSVWPEQLSLPPHAERLARNVHRTSVEIDLSIVPAGPRGPRGAAQHDRAHDAHLTGTVPGTNSTTERQDLRSHLGPRTPKESKAVLGEDPNLVSSTA